MMMREIYLKRMRKRVRGTCLLGKVFVGNTEFHLNLSLLYLNYYCSINAVSDEEDDDVVQDNDNEEDMASVLEVPDQYDEVYSNMPIDTHMLKPVTNCIPCGAKRFEHEPRGFCCRDGKIKLSELDVPDELMRLWSSNDPDAKHFRDNIRFFNGHFSFTSLYCRLDSATASMKNSGIYTFRAHGQIYHNIRSFGREDGKERRHLELYFYDNDPSLKHRYERCRKEKYQKDKEVIERLVAILQGNPYSQKLRSLGQAEDLEDYHVTLNLDQRLDQRTYNTPIADEVAAVWIEGSELLGQFQNSVVLHGKDRSRQGIRSYHGCYDALSYPLFFPKGELGWHMDIPKKDVTMEEVIKYRALLKAQSGSEDETGLLFFLFKYFTYMYFSGYYINN
jgi:hypothetical protein